MSPARTVVPTSASGGIGSAVVDRFLTNGGNVVAADLSEIWTGIAKRWDFEAEGGRQSALHSVAADISSEESMQAFAESVEGRASGRRRARQPRQNLPVGSV